MADAAAFERPVAPGELAADDHGQDRLCVSHRQPQLHLLGDPPRLGRGRAGDQDQEAGRRKRLVQPSPKIGAGAE